MTGGRGPDTHRAVVSFEDRETVPIYVASTNCEAVRTEYQKQLMEFIDVDSYGTCLRNKDGLSAMRKILYSKHSSVSAGTSSRLSL